MTRGKPSEQETKDIGEGGSELGIWILEKEDWE